MTSVKLEQLTAEDRKALMNELKAQESEAARKVKEARKAYKDLVNETIPVLYKNLKEVSELLTKAKADTFNGLKTLIAMKAEVFETSSADQFTHSFTTEDGITLVVGNRTTDNWDDTVTAGLQKVDEYLASLAVDTKSKMLVGMIKKLLAKDAKGNLKSSRVLQLKKEAEATGDKRFIDAVNIIMDAYRPIKGQQFVTVQWKDNEGKLQNLPLDITSAGAIEE